MRKISISLIATVSGIAMYAQQNMVTYAGGSGMERFNDVIQLSDGTFLVSGEADDLNWIDQQVPRIVLGNTGALINTSGTNNYAYLLHLASNLQQILEVVHLPQNAAEDLRFIKTTNIPGQPTGTIYVSGNLSSTSDGFFIGKLDNNFVNGLPTAFVWTYNVNGVGYPEEYQPWDVTSDGDVYFIRGDSHGYNWHEIGKLNGNTGLRTTVTNWNYHWNTNGQEVYADNTGLYTGSFPLSYSGLILKRNRCDLRSTSQGDYDLWQTDGNGGTKKGKWPADFQFNAPCNPQSVTANGPGYTGYGLPGTFTYGGSVICVDRRNNDLYVGMNFKSVLPSSLPDFEPAVIAMDSTGELRWWSRLYHEVQPDGDTLNSEPDQYIDALAIEYAQPLPNGTIVVNARCHGNNVENLWEGNEIMADTNASGFQNRFTGSSGNIHISWLGKLTTGSGTLLKSTYVAEYAEGTGGLGAPHSNPNLDGWPDPNSGWPDVNTTRLAKNNMKISASGWVCVAGVGRRTITTANAYQKMVKPANGGQSCWNSFVRVYDSNLNVPLYSSLVVGQWDTLTQAGGGNTDLTGIWKTADGVVAVGYHNGSPNELPVTNVPVWGSSNYSSGSAVLVYYTATNLVNSNDGPLTTAVAEQEPATPHTIYPNPATEQLYIRTGSAEYGKNAVLEVYDLTGRMLIAKTNRQTEHMVLALNNLPDGTYFLRITSEKNSQTERFVIKR